MIALVDKIKGPYEGLLDLPGGGVEFGESPIETLKREIREELAFEISSIIFHENYSYLGVYKEDLPYEFHHLGMVCMVNNFQLIPGMIAEERWGWHAINRLDPGALTPFALAVYSALST